MTRSVKDLMENGVLKHLDYRWKWLLVLMSALIVSGCFKDFSTGRSMDSSFQTQSATDGNLPVTVPSSEKRVALVIGNKYPGWGESSLKTTIADAQAIAATLERLGFEVTYKNDVDLQKMRGYLNELADKAKGGLALFYFAGHGMQYGNENFLIPVDFKKDVVNESLHASQVLESLENAKVPTKILIFDACRNWSEGRGSLAYMRSPAMFSYGTLIAFSTEPGTKAADQIKGSVNSPYATALLKYMPQGLPIKVMFDRVREEVRTITRGELSETLKDGRNRLEQTPWVSEAIDGGYLCLAPCVSPAAMTSGTVRCKIYVGQGIYDGECQSNIPHGQGTIKYKDDEYYQGSFSNGVRHGKGVQYLIDGTEVHGEWANGRLIKGKLH